MPQAALASYSDDKKVKMADENDREALLSLFCGVCFSRCKGMTPKRLLRKYELISAGTEVLLVDKKVGPRAMGKLVNLASEAQKRFCSETHAPNQQLLDLEAYITDSNECSDLVVQPFEHQPNEAYTFFLVSRPVQSEPTNEHYGMVKIPQKRNESGIVHNVRYSLDHLSI